MGAHSDAPDSLAEFREERWLRKTAGQRESERVRKGEKGGWEGRKKAKESRVVPHPKPNPGCATEFNDEFVQRRKHYKLLKL